MAEESIAGLYHGAGPPRPLDRASIQAEAEEGLLLAEYATRMRLKNRIIVDILTDGEHLDPDAWADEVRLSLGRLRLESEAAAKRMASERDLAARAGGVARHEHDYRRRDADNLERRRRVHTALAGRLIRWENDDERVAGLLAAARDDAYREMQAAIRVTLTRAAAVPEDADLLEERLRLLTAVDLPALAAARKEHLPQAPPAPQDPAPAVEDTAAPSGAGHPSLRRRLRALFHRR